MSQSARAGDRPIRAAGAIVGAIAAVAGLTLVSGSGRPDHAAGPGAVAVAAPTAAAVTLATSDGPPWGPL
jgi:hypothetical protein